MTSKSPMEEIYSKVGRNILLFQKLEFVIKYLVTISDITVNKDKTKQKNTIERVNDMKLTLGTVVGKYIETHNRHSQKNSVELNEGLSSFRVSNDCNVDLLEEKKKVLADMVAERNELVHHSLDLFQWDNPESCEVFIKKLDIQYERVDQLINELIELKKSLVEVIKLSIEYFSSEEYKKSAMHNNRVFHQLCYIATQIQRSDGWAVVDKAISQIDLEQAELELLKKQYGHRSYKKMMLATDLFDFQEEETSKGGVRLLYRLKPNWEFSVEENATGMVFLLKQAGIEIPLL